MNTPTKTCSKCFKDKPTSDYRYKNKTTGTLQAICKECCKVLGKAHYNKNKKVVIQKQVNRNRSYTDMYFAFKATLICANCGESTPYCLDFHHIDEKQKSTEVSNLAGTSWGSLIRELHKCVCLCSNCHRKAHRGDVQIKDEWIFGPSSLMKKALDFEANNCPIRGIRT